MEEYDAKEAWERKKQDARRDRVYLWMDRIVPYEIDSALGAYFNYRTQSTVKVHRKKVFLTKMTLFCVND